MSVYNIREKFSYVIATSSIDYIRNYNFNTSTISDIPITMANSDEEIPITVNMTTTEPWMQIVDPVSGNDLKMPNGNVILQPNSSAVVLLKIDLPAEIENVSETVIYPNINFDIKSGSFPIVLPSQTSGPTQTNTTQSIEERKNRIITAQEEYVLDIGERISVNLTVYDNDSNQDTKSRVLWRVTGTQVPPKDIEEIIRTENVSLTSAKQVVVINSPYDSKAKKRIWYPRTVVGRNPGTVYVLLTAVEDKPKGAKQVGKRTLIKFTVTNKLFRGNPQAIVTAPTTGSTVISVTGSASPPPPPPVDQDDVVEDGTP